MYKLKLGFLIAAGFILAGTAFLLWPRPAAAQCGSSVSSCKNCHEVQKQDPVNTKGAWHTEHAFGDFCEFCHAGNVKAKDQAAAHTGMVKPMADVKGSCQSCHPNDYQDRGKKYADVLGVSLTAGGSSGGDTSGGSGSTPGTGSGGAAAGGGPALPTGGQVIDLNQIYKETVSPAAVSNLGNWILVVLILGTLALLGWLVWIYEHPLERAVVAWRKLLATPALTPALGGPGPEVPAAVAARPELARVWPALAASDPRTLRALSNLLADRKNGPRVLQALGNVDLDRLTALRETDPKALAALLALVQELE